jgi:hypothetical protein
MSFPKRYFASKPTNKWLRYHQKKVEQEKNRIKSNFSNGFLYSPFCVQAKIIKLVGLKNNGGLSPINLVTFAVTQNGEVNLNETFFNILLMISQPFVGRF